MSFSKSFKFGWLHPLHAAGSWYDSRLPLPIRIPHEIADVQGLSAFAKELVEGHSAAPNEDAMQAQVILGQEGIEIRMDGHIGVASETSMPISLRFCDLAPTQLMHQQLIVIGRRDGLGKTGDSKQGNRCKSDGCFIDMWILVVQGDAAVLHSILDSMSSFGAVRSDFQAVYNLIERPIGSSSFSTVYVAKRIPYDATPASSTASLSEIGSETQVAAKVFLKGTLERSISETACSEAALLLEAQWHPNIIAFHGIFTFPDAVGSDTLRWVIAMGLCSKGDLHAHVLANGPFSEEHAVKIAIGVLAALAHIHARCIVHRDVKAQNIMLSENNRPLLSDFGIASRLSTEDGLERPCGTPGYVAPEILNGLKYDGKVDVFSTGVVLYFILGRSLPFSGADIAIVFSRTVTCKIEFPPASFGHVTHHMKQFVRLLMHKEPRCRLSAHRANFIAWSNWCRPRLESARWLRDMKSQAKQRYPCPEAGKAAAQANLALENAKSEGIEDPIGHMDPKLVKDEVLSAARPC